MSIFGKIKNAIFGETAPWERDMLGRPKNQPQSQQPQPAPQTTPDKPAMPQMQQPAPAPAERPTAAEPAPAQPVDVEAVLTQRLQAKGNPDLNWRTSIVDLMKLLDLDSSLDNRKELATELGYTGAKDGSAEMNIWLHKAVMQALARHGGKVPAGMAD